MEFVKSPLARWGQWGREKNPSFLGHLETSKYNCFPSSIVVNANKLEPPGATRRTAKSILPSKVLNPIFI